jgi:hypothetical protein
VLQPLAPLRNCQCQCKSCACGQLFLALSLSLAPSRTPPHSGASPSFTKLARPSSPLFTLPFRRWVIYFGLLNVKVVKLYLEFGWGRDGIFAYLTSHSSNPTRKPLQQQ